MDKVSIFVHEKGKFLYFREKDNMPNNYMIDPDLLQFSIILKCRLCAINNDGISLQERFREHILPEEVSLHSTEPHRQGV